MASPLHSRDCAVFSPYLIPRALRDRKVANIGDGFILRAIERLLGPVPVDRLFSTREPLSDQTRALLGSCRALISAGANQLNDYFTVLPGLTADQLRTLDCPVVLIGIGIHGLPKQTERMSDATKEILREVHRRVPYSSWRCPLTIAYLERELPELQGRFLMTGCPVIYDRGLLEGSAFLRASAAVAVTSTERGDFLDRELHTLRFVQRRFPDSRRYFVVHQNFSPPGRLEAVRHRLVPLPDTRPAAELRRRARKLGFEVILPATADDAARFYETVDLHIGSRLHAHLHFLSQCKWTFLTYVDERMTGMAQAYGFPICRPEELSDRMGFDFEVVRERARLHYSTMMRFTDSLGTVGRFT